MKPCRNDAFEGVFHRKSDHISAFPHPYKKAGRNFVAYGIFFYFFDVNIKWAVFQEFGCTCSPLTHYSR